MNKRRMLAALAAALALTGVALPAAAQTKLKWAHLYETPHPYHRWALWAADEVKKRTGGRYEVQVFPASTLGKQTELNQGLLMATVDIASSSTSFAAQAFPRIGVGYYPYTFRDAAHLLKFAKSDVFAELAEGYRKKTGVQIVSMTYYGTRHSTSNKPFKSCDEMKGLKIRVPDAPAYTALPRACGANPTPIAFSEVYLALQNGTADAQENPLTTIESMKFFEVQKNVILTGHIVDSLSTEVGPHVWNKLSEADRATFSAVMQEAAQKASDDISRREVELIDEFKKKGLKVIDVNRDEFRDRVIKAVDMKAMGYDRKDWDRIQAVR
ncbi:MAG: sialic acid TRAP transporter substrate-binding protein SiaP [Frateuria sp.]|nr:sialic acid TRAP transporter substrate-binding protein SiaP [Frateuria sp.]